MKSPYSLLTEQTALAVACAPVLSAQLIARGFALVETGGGCTAWQKDCGHGMTILVTSHDEPTYPADSEPCAVGVYVSHHCEQLALTVHPSGLALAELLREAALVQWSGTYTP